MTVDLDLRIPVTRRAFETWIADDLRAIEGSIDSLLQSSGITQSDVDRVFLTGGSSFVPAVRRIFSSRFGKERIRGGHEFMSVVHGLGWRARQREGLAESDGVRVAFQAGWGEHKVK